MNDQKPEPDPRRFNSHKSYVDDFNQMRELLAGTIHRSDYLRKIIEESEPEMKTKAYEDTLDRVDAIVIHHRSKNTLLCLTDPNLDNSYPVREREISAHRLPVYARKSTSRIPGDDSVSLSIRKYRTALEKPQTAKIDEIIAELYDAYESYCSSLESLSIFKSGTNERIHFIAQRNKSIEILLRMAGSAAVNKLNSELGSETVDLLP